MLVIIPDLLDFEDLKYIQEFLGKTEFIDGKASAGIEASRVKNNSEMNASEEDTVKLNNLVMGKLVQNPIYQAAAFPQRVAAPYYAKYTEGMSYGKHIDNPVMGFGGTHIRADVSITIFLNDSENYDGGELEIDTAFGTHGIKLDAGYAVLYSSGSTHHVRPITRGERLVAVTWLQSMIRNPEQRDLLFKLKQARDEMIRKSPDEAETELVSNTYINLVRMWAEVA